MRNKLIAKNQKGFTLIEIIVVIVILAVLAAMILPRFLDQGERAVIAEAQNTLGALRRAEAVWQDSAGGGAYLTTTAAGMTLAEANLLGLRAIPNSANWTYVCAAGAPNLCAAQRAGGAAADFISTDIDTGGFACGGAGSRYVLVNPAQPNRGCQPVR